jgi:hypothetical protein
VPEAWAPGNERGAVTDRWCDAVGTRLRYQLLAEPGPDGRRFRISSAGPDRRHGTADDLYLPAVAREAERSVAPKGWGKGGNW